MWVYCHILKTRGPKGGISCTWVQCATYLRNRPRRTFLFTDWPALGRGRWDLASCQVSLKIFRLAVSEEKSKMSRQIRGQGGHLVFPISPKNTNLVEDIEILLPVKFRWILFSGFRGEVENVSTNQRPGRPSCFSDQHEKHKLCRGCWDLASCQVSLNSVQRFQRRSRKCLSQSEARAAILFFRSAWKTQIRYRMLSSCFLSSFVEFCSVVSEEKLKMWKVNDGRTTDNAWSQ